MLTGVCAEKRPGLQIYEAFNSTVAHTLEVAEDEDFTVGVHAVAELTGSASFNDDDLADLRAPVRFDGIEVNPGGDRLRVAGDQVPGGMGRRIGKTALRVMDFPY